MKKTSLLFTSELPRPKELGEELILIYDEILPKRSESFKKWSQQFSRKYKVTAGEKLKAVDRFPQHMLKILELCQNTSSRNLTLVVVGGGSVGDFGGFVASILKRGVRLVLIPSTWLAAIDSAHGGKTALNVGSAKNQIGTFWPAEKVVLVKSLLMAQPEARSFEGFGELLKISLLAGGSLWKELSQEKQVTSKTLWKHLEKAIQSKYKIVFQDPQEKTGYRHILNLGHTLGHIFESYYKLPHGVAINYGLDFAIHWSVQRKLMKTPEYDQLMRAPISGFLLSGARDDLFPVNAKDLKSFRELLLSDKKKTKSATLRFIFLEKPGRCVVREVTVDEILVEVIRQREAELHG